MHLILFWNQRTAKLRNSVAGPKDYHQKNRGRIQITDVCGVNYLAHLVLSGPDDDLLLGNFIGDAVKGRPEVQFDDGVSAGIRFHRWIDHYADQHPIAQQMRALLRPALGRFSGVGVDLIYDHFLAKHFDELIHLEGGLAGFAADALARLSQRTDEMPLRSHRFFEAMKQHDWLNGYAHRSQMLQVCRAMDQRLELRLGVKPPLHRLFEIVDEQDENQCATAFIAFWNEIVRDAAEFRKNVIQANAEFKSMELTSFA